MSHFTSVKTEIHDIVCLKKALKDLNFQFTEATAEEKIFVKGYLGQKTKADMAIHISKTYDIGVKVGQKGIEFVADWWGVEISRGLTEKEFIKIVTQKYAYHKVKEVVQKKGYTLAEEKVEEDNTIHIKVKQY
jgi:hypothetical protein